MTGQGKKLFKFEKRHGRVTAVTIELNPQYVHNFDKKKIIIIIIIIV